VPKFELITNIKFTHTLIKLDGRPWNMDKIQWREYCEYKEAKQNQVLFPCGSLIRDFSHKEYFQQVQQQTPTACIQIS